MGMFDEDGPSSFATVDVAQAYAERARPAQPPEDPAALAPLEPWHHEVRPVLAKAEGHKRLPVDAVRVAMLRAAGVEDTVALGDALGIAPAKVCALEVEPGYGDALKRIKLAAGLGNWRSHVENVVATGMLPSGMPAPAPTQAQLLTDLWEREEPKPKGGNAVDDSAGKLVLNITGEAMARIMGGLAEARGPVVDITPRQSVPATDDELERQRKVYAEEVEEESTGR